MKLPAWSLQGNWPLWLMKVEFQNLGFLWVIPHIWIHCTHSFGIQNLWHLGYCLTCYILRLCAFIMKDNFVPSEPNMRAHKFGRRFPQPFKNRLSKKVPLIEVFPMPQIRRIINRPSFPMDQFSIHYFLDFLRKITLPKEVLAWSMTSLTEDTSEGAMESSFHQIFSCYNLSLS